MHGNAKCRGRPLFLPGQGVPVDFYQMLFHSPECRFITPVVRKIMLLLWVPRTFEDTSSGGKELKKNGCFFLSTEPRGSSPGGHVLPKVALVGGRSLPNAADARTRQKPEKARLRAHLPGSSSESIYAQMQ